MVEKKGKKLIRVLIADDSSSVREVLKEIFRQTDDIIVIAEATNGKEAIEKALDLKPDLITMDISMPVLSGYEAIERIMSIQAVPILVVSSLDDAQTSLKAVSKGALDLFPKSDIASDEFVEKVRLVSTIKVITHLGSGKKDIETEVDERVKASVFPPMHIDSENQPNGIVAIASSTGGPQALSSLLSAIPINFPYPIVIAQHIALGFTDGLVNTIGNNTILKVKKGECGERLKPGTVYVSPSSKHMIIEKNREINFVERQTTDIYFPSCDLLLTAAADVYGDYCIGVILTGMGRDGVVGMKRIKESGGKTIAQNEETSIVFGMPKVAIAEGCIDVITSIDDIANKLLAISDHK